MVPTCNDSQVLTAGKDNNVLRLYDFRCGGWGGGGGAAGGSRVGAEREGAGRERAWGEAEGGKREEERAG